MSRLGTKVHKMIYWLVLGAVTISCKLSNPISGVGKALTDTINGIANSIIKSITIDIKFP